MREQNDELMEALIERVDILERVMLEIGDEISDRNVYYDDDDDFDSEFEIVCPYCGVEFPIDLDNEIEGEVKCPECNETIELNWDDDDLFGCSDDECSLCKGCGAFDEDAEYKFNNMTDDDDEEDEER